MGAVLVWEAVSQIGILHPAFFPPPSRVLVALVLELRTGEIPKHAWVTLTAYARGLVLALAVGIPWGVLLGRVRSLRRASAVLIEMLRPIPSVAIIPVAILLLGIGEEMRFAVACYAAVWPLLFNTTYGVYNTDPVLVDTARIFGFAPWEVLLRVVVPSALPFIATGVRVSSAVALIVTVTAEMVAGTGGLGFYVKATELGGRIPEMYGGILLLGTLGYLLNHLLRAAEGRALRWYRGAMGRAEEVGG
ncbi:MAG: ABC transporter permease [Armatimonadota bacterium]|nr:ABC transporter permease [Armatimonadota bacterium]MDR7600936.1 ABC transporter permease [Armatimonadota bacterium]